MALDSYKCKLYPLSPIHIGSGYILEPFDYIVKNNMFYRIDIISIFDKLDDKNKDIFTEKVEEGIIPFRAFISDLYKEEYGYIYKSTVDSEFVLDYNSKLKGAKNKNDEGRFLVKEFAGGINGKYIPGSSLKGSIRGAYIYSKLEKANYVLDRNQRIKTKPIILLNEFRKKVNKKQASEMDTKFTKEAFEMNDLNAFADPFKRITLTDTTSMQEITKVGKVKRISIDKEKSFKEGNLEYLEVLKSKYSDNYNEPLDFSFGIRYLEKEARDLTLNMKKYQRVSEILNFESLDFIESLNEKFSDIIEEELNFYNRSNEMDIRNFYLDLREELNNLEDNEAIIRIGKGSGFATFTHLLKSNNQNIRSASRLLLDNKYPLGWAKIVIEERE
jgi:CRISPR type III-A-associated RAMP protein Csm5